MSRSGYSYDCEGGQLWRNAVARSISGKRGQKFLRELVAALDAMQVHELVESGYDCELVNLDGEACALGAVALSRGWVDAKEIDSSDHKALAARLDIAPCLVQEIEFENDETGPFGALSTENAGRWVRLRAWVESLIIKEPQEKEA